MVGARTGEERAGVGSLRILWCGNCVFLGDFKVEDQFARGSERCSHHGDQYVLRLAIRLVVWIPGYRHVGTSVPETS